MYVSDLKAQLDTLPDDVWIDVMFSNDASLFNISDVELYNLSQGNQRVVIEITENAPLRAV